MPPRPPRFRADLEGLRGVAIVLVVLFHAGLGALNGGFIGVDLFFVLSGFFISAGLARELETTGQIDLNAFWGRRMLRLSPPLLVVLLTTLGLVMLLYAPIDRAQVGGFSRFVAFYSGNIQLAASSRDYFSTHDNPLLHTWSLGVEEQFYLLWPLLLLVPGVFMSRRLEAGARSTRPLMVTMLIAGIASLIGSAVLTSESQPWAFYGVFTRVWEFAIGGIIAIVLLDRETRTPARAAWLMQAIAAILLVVAIVRFDEGTPYPGLAAVVPALAAALFIIGGDRTPGSSISRMLEQPMLRWLGRVSYAWYLWHWPLAALGVALHPTIGTTEKLAWSVAALVPAWLTYRFVEGSARSGRLSRIATDRLALYGVTASGVAALIALGAMRFATSQTAYGEQRRFALARSDRFTRNCWAETVEDWKPCHSGDVQSTTTVALLGDSHAEHWLGALDRAGKDYGWKIDAMVKGGCPVSDAPEMTHPRRIRHYRECARFRETMVQRIIREKPSMVILSSWDQYIATEGRGASWQVTPEQWEAGLRRTYQRITAAGIQVIAMRDNPQTPFDVPQCLSRRAAALPFAGPCDYSRASTILAPAVAAQNNAARGLPVSFIDMNDVMCPGARCSPIRNGHVVFTDNNHLTASYSRSIGDILGARIAAAASGQRVSRTER